MKKLKSFTPTPLSDFFNKKKSFIKLFHFKIFAKKNTEIGRACLGYRSKVWGFTLIELILYLALAGAIVIGISSLLVTIIQVKEKNKVIYEVEYQGTRLMDEISQSVRNARSVNAPDPGTSASSLSLATDNPATNPTIFSLLEDKANIKEGAADPVDLTSSNVRITDLNFENSAIEAVLPDVIRISFTVSYNAQDNRREHIYQKTYQTTVALRNSP